MKHKNSGRIIKPTIAMQSQHTVVPYIEFKNMTQVKEFLSNFDFSMTPVGVLDFKLGYCYKFYLGDSLVRSDVDWCAKFTMVSDGHLDDQGHVLARVQFPETARPTLVRILPDKSHNHAIIRQSDLRQVYPPCRRGKHCELANFKRYLSKNCYSLRDLQR